MSQPKKKKLTVTFSCPLTLYEQLKLMLLSGGDTKGISLSTFIVGCLEEYAEAHYDEALTELQELANRKWAHGAAEHSPNRTLTQ